MNEDKYISNVQHTTHGTTFFVRQKVRRHSNDGSITDLGYEVECQGVKKMLSRYPTNEDFFRIKTMNY